MAQHADAAQRNGVRIFVSTLIDSQTMIAAKIEDAVSARQPRGGFVRPPPAPPPEAASPDRSPAPARMRGGRCCRQTRSCADAARNPKGRIVILFGALVLFALIGGIAIDRRLRQRLNDFEWQQSATRTSLIPLTALISGRWRPSWFDLGFLRLRHGNRSRYRPPRPASVGNRGLCPSGEVSAGGTSFRAFPALVLRARDRTPSPRFAIPIVSDASG